MLSVFPEILFLSPFAATILRIAAASVFLYAAKKQAQESAALSETPVVGIGKGAWIVWTSIIIDVVVGAMLLVGIYTQVAALAGMIGVGAALLLGPSYLERIPLARGVAALTFVILLSLLFTGAGAFAIDWPL